MYAATKNLGQASAASSPSMYYENACLVMYLGLDLDYMLSRYFVSR